MPRRDRVDIDSLIQRSESLSEGSIEYEYEYRDAEYEYEKIARTSIVEYSVRLSPSTFLLYQPYQNTLASS